MDITMLFDHIPADNRNTLKLLIVLVNLAGLCQSLTQNLNLFLMQLNFDLLFVENQIHFKVIMVQSLSMQLKYLLKKGVNHIRGFSYHPQSQGAVEAFNKTIL